MTHLQKLRTLSSLRWVSLNFARSNVKSSTIVSHSPKGSYHIVQSTRFYGRKYVKVARSVPKAVWKEAQAALLEYLHTTRRMPFLDAEQMSRNSPIFLRNLLKRVNGEKEIGRSLTKFLQYHPINEFEPFFESIGLKPLEYSPFLPRHLIFLEDDAVLLENYHVLCSYGIPRDIIGKIYKEAEVFRYDHRVLQANLQAFENVGLNLSSIVKIISSSPGLLIGSESTFLCKVIENLKSIGIGSEWIEERVGEEGYNWSHMLELLHLLNTMVSNEEQLRKIIHHCPAFLFDASGNTASSFLGFLLKFGIDNCDMGSTFLKLPQVQARKFVTNLRGCYKFLLDIHTEVEDIGKIVRSHPVLLGSCSLKKLSSLRKELRVGSYRILDIVKENPEVLKQWVYGSRVGALPELEEDLSAKLMKSFLLDLGFSEKSNEMQKTLKRLQGNAREFQERFDAVVNAGLSRNDVTKMIKVAPEILSHSKKVIETKINFLVNELGYPISSVVEFPGCVCYTTQRVKLRVLMYVWLRDHGSVRSKKLRTIVARSEEKFTRLFVNKHPMGPQVWQELKKQIYADP